jgi:hypothetical protein
VYDGNIKTSLLDYIHTSLLFSDRGVDPNVIAMNRCGARPQLCMCMCLMRSTP